MGVNGLGRDRIYIVGGEVRCVILRVDHKGGGRESKIKTELFNDLALLIRAFAISGKKVVVRVRN